MLRKQVSQIFKEVVETQDRPGKIRVLRQNDHPAVRGYLKMVFDKNLKWELPPGAPPYKECKEVDVDHVLYHEFRRLYIFLKGGNPNLKANTREVHFVALLESLSPGDAKFLVDVVKDHKIPQGIDEGLLKEAYGKDF